ncbi:MFS transporter, partial [Pseudomonadota bacterium]
VLSGAGPGLYEVGPGVGEGQGAILKDWRFQTIVPAALMGPFIMTGLFFHQLALADAKGWEISLLAASFPAFAGATVISSLTCGWLVDRFGPGRVLPGFVWPLALALVVVASTNGAMGVPLYMMLGGLTVGASTVLISSAWADVFGVKYLGSIRALTSALTVLSTAIAPLWAGWLLDTGWAVESIALGAAAIVVATGVAAQFPAKNLRDLRSAKFL